MRSDSILGTEICEALGLNPRDITALKVDVSPNRVEVVAVMLLREGQGTAFKEVLRRYRLVPESKPCSVCGVLEQHLEQDGRCHACFRLDLTLEDAELPVGDLPTMDDDTHETADEDTGPPLGSIPNDFRTHVGPGVVRSLRVPGGFSYGVWDE